MLGSPKDILDYWFRNSRGATLDVIQEHMGLWFGRASPEFDEVQAGSFVILFKI